MVLIRHYSPQTRLDHYELDGLLNVLDREIDDMGENGDFRTPYYVGAKIAMQILRFHEFVETQHDFMLIFNKYINDLNDEEGSENA